MIGTIERIEYKPLMNIVNNKGPKIDPCCTGHPCDHKPTLRKCHLKKQILYAHSNNER